MASALPILKTSGDSFTVARKKFDSVLKKVGDRPFVLLSMNGPTRKRKSYALSFFICYWEAKKAKDANWLRLEEPGILNGRGGSTKLHLESIFRLSHTLSKSKTNATVLRPEKLRFF